MSLNKRLSRSGDDLKRDSGAAQEGVYEFLSEDTPPAPSAGIKDFFIERDGERYAGTHLIVDLIGAHRLDDLDHIERTLRRCVEASNATLLHIHLHHFTPNGGVSGVAVLAESHISIHSWPERGYAALDIFMCGCTDPQKALPVLEQAFTPHDVKVQEIRRGKDLA